MLRSERQIGVCRAVSRFPVIARPVRLSGRGNPPVREEMYRQLPYRTGNTAIFGGNRNLVPFIGGIATTSVRYSLAMTGNLEPARETPIFRAAE